MKYIKNSGEEKEFSKRRKEAQKTYDYWITMLELNLSETLAKLRWIKKGLRRVEKLRRRYND